MALQTATNPATGERVALVGDQWQPITQSATNKQGVKAYLVGGNWLTDDAPAASNETPATRGGPSPYAAAPSNPTLKALYSPVAGMYRGLQDITDTAYIAATEALGIKGAREESARQTAQFEQQYGGTAGAEVGPLHLQIPLHTSRLLPLR
jgi:hypothetical protein